MYDNIHRISEILMLPSGELRAERIAQWGCSKQAKPKQRNEKEKNECTVYYITWNK